MKKKFWLLTIISLSMSVFCGCASMTKITDEQADMVSEYSAALLLKYDTGKHSRLVDTSDFLNNYYSALEIREESIRKYEEQKAKEEAKKQESANDASKEDATVVDNTDKGSGGATVVDSRTLSEFIDSDFEITYAGYDITDSYPEDGDDLFFSMDATRGNDLLIIYFNVTNKSSESKKLDILGKIMTFKLSVNGGKYHASLKAMLEDELSEFSGTFAGSETRRLVLVDEVQEGTVIDEIMLKVYDLNSDSLSKKLTP